MDSIIRNPPNKRVLTNKSKHMAQKIINARFNSKCAATGKRILKGEQMLYDYSTKKCYCMTTQEAISHQNGTAEGDNMAAYIQGQEEAYFDNFCMSNNI